MTTKQVIITLALVLAGLAAVVGLKSLRDDRIPVAAQAMSGGDEELIDRLAEVSNGESGGTTSSVTSPMSEQAVNSPNTESADQRANVPEALRAPSQSEQERETLNALTTILADTTRLESSPADLVKQLEAAGYQPIASRDDDDATGSMLVVETKNALPGSRYFRAQYFSDEEGLYQAQHMSFELRPGTSRQSVVQALEAKFGRLGRPALETKEWLSYKMPERHQTVWIKTITPADVAEGDAIHARSKEDVGTLWVAVEAELDGHEDELTAAN